MLILSVVTGAPRGAGGGQPILPGDVHLRLQGELPPSRGPAAGGLGLADTGHVTTVLTPGWSQDIVLPGLAAEALGLVLEFVYTGKLALSPRNIQAVLACASQLQVSCRTSDTTAELQTLCIKRTIGEQFVSDLFHQFIQLKPFATGDNLWSSSSLSLDISIFNLQL